MVFFTRNLHPGEIKKRNPLTCNKLRFTFCGPDGTRTRDPVRDRHVF